ncbi:hypothetical protein TH63_04845 [Rufibacter radiotolerans]|uniref:Glycosyltransferase n=2 Tax=Rufibacter radiotolerans TaxID=1379910 RepID=A0A0H4VHF9_9BACT|nr:hypothetical protein TH63_04845 [Rufibacter radiotolerans]
MLQDNGYQVTVFLSDNQVQDYSNSIEKGVQVVRFNVNSLSEKMDLDYSARLSYAFVNVLKKVVDLHGKPDIIEAQDYLGVGYYLLQFKHTLSEPFVSIPVLLTLHSPAFLYLEYNRVATYKFPEFWICEMEKQAIVSASYLVTPTEFLAKEIDKTFPLDKNKVSLVPNPYQRVNRELDIQADITPGKVVYYGKLSRQKGSFALLAYFKDLWDEGHTCQLYMVGAIDIVYHVEMRTMGDILQQKYQAYIKKGLLHFVGKITPQEAAAYVADAQVVVFPSLIDNLPYAVIEMMDLGKVVLASKQGGQREIIEDGKTGFLFDHSISGDFKQQLTRILELSTQELIDIGKRAQKSILEKYSYATIFPQKAKVIQALLETGVPPVAEKFPFVYQEAFATVPAQNDMLTVIIPFYNMGQYINETLQSVLASDYPHLELIIIDDGSTEAQSIQVLQEIEKDPKITVLRKQNEGLATARNFGASKAAGSYIAFLDADDKVSPTYYFKAISILKAYSNVFFVGCWVQYFGRSEKTWITFNPQPPYLLTHNMINSSGLVYKKDAFLMAGQNDAQLEFGLEDYDSVLGLVKHGFNGVAIPEFHFHYRVRKGSMFRSLNKNKLVFSYKYIAEKHSLLFSKFGPQISHLLTANGPGFFYESPTEEINLKLGSGLTSSVKSFGKKVVNKNAALKKMALFGLRLLKY